MDRDKSIRNKDIEIFRFLRMQVTKLVAINRQSRYGFNGLNGQCVLLFYSMSQEKKIDDGKNTYFIFIVSMK